MSKIKKILGGIIVLLIGLESVVFGVSIKPEDIIGDDIQQKMMFQSAIYDFRVNGLIESVPKFLYVSQFEDLIGARAYYLSVSKIIMLKRDVMGKEMDAIRHEVGHSVSWDDVKSGAFDNYCEERIGDYELGLYSDSKVNEFNQYTLGYYEIVAEDIVYTLYGIDTMQKHSIGVPSEEQQTELLRILKSEVHDGL